MNDTVIQAENIAYTYPFQRESAIRNVSFKLRRGEAMLVTGANGAGKTTLSRLVAGLLKPSSGTFIFGGESLVARERRKRVAFVMQQMDVQLYMRTVEEELLYSAPRGTPRKERASAARKWMKESVCFRTQVATATRYKRPFPNPAYDARLM